MIYLSELENTIYNLPSVVTTGTCCIGFASKGPVGIPTLINSYQNYVQTFGTPTSLANSSIAARSVLNASDNYIFVRVADGSLSNSNVIVKDAITATNGKTWFNKSTDWLIGAPGYNYGSIYTFNLKTFDMESNNPGKDFYIRSPASSKLTQASVLNQILSQIGETKGTFEFKVPNNGFNAGLYSFNVEINGYNIFGDSTPENSVFISLPANSDGQFTSEVIKNALTTGSNSVAVLEVNGDIGNPAITETEELGFTADTVKKFVLEFNGTQRQEVPILISAAMTYGELATELNNLLKSSFNVSVFFKPEVRDQGNIVSKAKFIFVNGTKGVDQTINILGLNWEGGAGEVSGVDDSLEEDLFATYASAAQPIDGIPKLNTSELYESISLLSKTLKANTMLAIGTNVDVIYNVDTKSIILYTPDAGTGQEIELVAAENGNFILDATKAGQVIPLGSIVGQQAVEINVYRDTTTRQIIFESVGDMTPPTVGSISSLPSGYLDMIGIQNGDETWTNSLVNGVTEKQGNQAVSANSRDMVVISSIQKGTDTTDIRVVKRSSVNPIDGAVRYSIEVWEKNILKETFSDLNFGYQDVANRFDTVINETPENGGSSIINVEVVKNDFADPNVQFANGEWYVGRPYGTNTTQKPVDIDPSAYTMYDYMVGSNGIPEDGGDELFEEALDINGELSNIELYNFHILITPDNISPVVQDAAIRLAEFRKDFLYLVDSPFGLSTQSVIDWHNGKAFGRGTAIDSTYAALYWPWVKTYDSDNKRYAWVPPSTMMAAKLVNLDSSRGCWFAPAGETNGRFGVGDIEYSARQSERDDLYTYYNRVNPIIKYNDGSIVIFGEKTLSRLNSSLTKVHTRRMVIDLKKKIRAQLRPFLFLPNIPSNWSKCAALINSVLEVYKVGGGITYYKTTIDSTTTTAELMQQDIMSGIINIVPAGVIEQIDLTISLDKAAESINVE
ncbi:MAG: phage tail sheath subtilisin-like domain-containing protein [Elusimicrobiota bacterium]|nr:phage tail sheath subtilisin-like domain-containing protein [Elusimicrobiota bacterium]